MNIVNVSLKLWQLLMDSNKLKADSRHAAVMVLHELSSDSLILTKRTESMRSHPGEVCFPGGAWEQGDETLYATALRELHEELGITADRVSLIQEMKTQTTLLGSIIHPWLATIESVYPYILNPYEVERLIKVPMSSVKIAQNYKQVIVDRDGYHFKSCEFIFNEDWIWGATAKIMQQLVSL